MAESMCVPGVLYWKWVPGLNGTGWARKLRTHGVLVLNLTSTSCPEVMVSRSRTRMAFNLSDGWAGASSGKKERTGSSMLSFPSWTASPTAVEVKLLLKECRTWGLSAASGFHHPSATTFPCRTTRTLCRVWTSLSATSTNSRSPAEERPSASGELLGRPVWDARTMVKPAHKTRRLPDHRGIEKGLTEGE